MDSQYEFNQIEILQHDMKILEQSHKKKIDELLTQLDIVRKQIPINLKCAQLPPYKKPIIECRFQKKCKQSFRVRNC